MGRSQVRDEFSQRTAATRAQGRPEGVTMTTASAPSQAAAYSCGGAAMMRKEGA